MKIAMIPIDPTALTDEVMRQFWDKTQRRDDGCIVWTSWLHRTGYASFRFGGRLTRVHRLAYTWAKGRPIPEGLVIDHLCGVRHCVNPDHLEAVTQEENVSRTATSITTANARKAHCIHGHAFTKENTYIRPRAGRACRECVRASKTKYNRRVRAAAKAINQKETKK